MSTPSIYSALKKILFLLSSKEKWCLCKIMGCALCTSILEMATAISIVVLSLVLNNPASGYKYFEFIGLNNQTTANKIIILSALSVGFIYIAKNILATIEVLYQNFSIQKINYEFKLKLLQLYAKAYYGFHITRNSNIPYSIIANDSETLFSNGLIALAMLFSESLVFVALTLTLIILEPNLAATLIGIGVISWLILTKKLLPSFYRWGKKLQQYFLLEHKHLLQFFHGFKEIMLYGKCSQFIAQYATHAQKRTHVQAIRNVFNILPRIVTELVFVFILIGTIIYFCNTSVSPQKMASILAGYLYVGFRLMPGLNRIITQLSVFKSIIPSLERIHSEYTTALNSNSSKSEKKFYFNQNIVLNNISYKHPGSQNYTLKNINLTIKKGECIGIIGKTGSGKSTLSDIILGLLAPDKGSILIDDKYPCNSYQWQASIGYVQQSIYLIDDSIRANILFGESDLNINSAQLKSAIYAAQLDDFLEKLPDGINTIVGERGMRLSGGEKQRIAVARALYRDPEVFVFDEATSALDSETETQLMHTINMLHSQQRTTILIAHRITTLKKCDRIIVMKNGEIEKTINYAELSDHHTDIINC